MADTRAADLAAEEAEIAEPHTLFVKNLAWKTRALPLSAASLLAMRPTTSSASWCIELGAGTHSCIPALA